MYQRTIEAFARAYWHWFFFIQPARLPEALIAADPVRYLHRVMGNRFAGLGAFDPAALAESVCEDYRASATIDLEHDRADVAMGRRMVQPLRVLWGEHGTVARCFDVLALWRERAQQVSGAPLPCVHYIAEEAPEALIQETLSFLPEPLNRSTP